MRWKPSHVCFCVGLLSITSPSFAQTPPDVDEQTLKAAGISIDDASLFKFFAARSLKDGERKSIDDLIKQLASETYKDREQAQRELIQLGPRATNFLLTAKKDAPLEVQRRIDIILKKLETVGGPELPVSAARLLAARQTSGGLEALLNYVPYTVDDWVEEEVLHCIGQLAFKSGKADPLLLSALKDKLAPRRAAAVYVFGRRGGVEARDAVRDLLADPEEIVRVRAAQALAGKRPFLAAKDLAAADLALLKAQNIGSDEPALLEFLRKRTLGEEDQRRLQKLIADLGDPAFGVRNRAAKLLVKEGTPAIAFLKTALNDPVLERSQRAQKCIDEIRRGPGPALPSAVVRLLTQPAASKEYSPAAAIRVLLGYAPFADDEGVEHEVFTALTLLSVREPKIDPLLPEALADAMPARRAAAAYVLSRVGLKDQVMGIRKLLDDAAPAVRLQAAYGLMLARDKSGVPPLIELLATGPDSAIWQVEDSLHRLAGDKAPNESAADAAPAKRQAIAKAWAKWWQDNSSTTDLALLYEGDIHLGLTLVCEYDSAIGQPGGQVWEAARDAKPRWTIKGVMGAMDAQVLPNGHILVAENSANRVTERDQSGKIHWEYNPPGNSPIVCQRLPNGNTFIATYNAVMEIKPDKSVVYNVNRGPQFYIFSAQRLRNGQVVAMTAQGVIHHFDPLTNKEIKVINTGPNGGWCSVEALPNGHYLVATMNNGKVREIDADNKTYWSVQLPGAFRATRLPNGNTIVASMTTRKVVEFDRSGNKRWEKTCQGRPWSVHYR